MKNGLKFLIFLILFNLYSIAQNITTVKPVDNGKALLNPNMGWNLAYFTDDGSSYGPRLPKGDVLDWFPGCNTIYFRIGWGRIEKQNGQFDWNYTDSIAKYWVARGKQVAFCWISFTTIAQSAPLWLRDLGAKGWIYPDGNYWGPNWDDPLYLKYYDRFIAEAAKHYGKDPSVSFIELGIGVWGEGHSYHPKSGTHPSPPITDEIAKLHMDMLRKYFPTQKLFVNDDMLVDPLGKREERPELIKHALAKDYGLSDWSVLVDTRALEVTGKVMELFWQKQPTLIEHEHYGPSYQRKVWDNGDEIVRAIEKYHATHLRIHWWPDEFLNGNGKDLPGNKDLVDRINKRIGYRIRITEAQWPETVKKGTVLKAKIKLSNAGVAPCYQGGFPTLSILDSKGNVVAQQTLSSQNIKDLKVGPGSDEAPKTPVEFNLQILKSLPKGIYNVAVSVGDEKGNPVFELPYNATDDYKRYLLGTVTVKD